MFKVHVILRNGKKIVLDNGEGDLYNKCINNKQIEIFIIKKILIIIWIVETIMLEIKISCFDIILNKNIILKYQKYSVIIVIIIKIDEQLSKTSSKNFKSKKSLYSYLKKFY